MTLIKIREEPPVGKSSDAVDPFFAPEHHLSRFLFPIMPLKELSVCLSAVSVSQLAFRHVIPTHKSCHTCSFDMNEAPAFCILSYFGMYFGLVVAIRGCLGCRVWRHLRVETQPKPKTTVVAARATCHTHSQHPQQNPPTTAHHTRRDGAVRSEDMRLIFSRALLICFWFL